MTSDERVKLFSIHLQEHCSKSRSGSKQQRIDAAKLAVDMHIYNISAELPPGVNSIGFTTECYEIITTTIGRNVKY